jgi:hypothetical protein
MSLHSTPLLSICTHTHLGIDEDQVFGEDEAHDVAAVLVEDWDAAVAPLEDQRQHLMYVAYVT